MPTSLLQIDIGTFLRREYDAILARWTREVAQLPSAGALSRPALHDHIPQLLDELIELSDKLGHGEEALPELALAHTPEQHALRRLDESFDLYEVVQEYARLRMCILESIMHGKVFIPTAQWRLLNGAIDHAVAVAVKAFAQAQQQTLRGLDSVSAASLQSPSLEDLLNRLLGVFRESVRPADIVLILLREGERLVVRASAGLGEPFPPGYALRLDQGFAGRVFQNREPCLLEDAAQDPLIVSDALREVGVQALYGVPLMAAGEVVGVAHMGSLTARGFSHQDRRLFGILADRASTAIAQHLLREALRASEQRYRATFDQAAVGMAHVALDGHWLQHNRRLCEILGYGPDELSGLTFQQLTYPPDLDADLTLLEQLLAGQINTYAMEKRYIRKDGRPVWANLTVALVRDARQQPEYLIAVVEDIDARKQAEAERQASTQAEQRARARLDAIVQAAPVGIGVLDNDLRYVLVNESLARLNGHPVEAHPGARVRDMVPQIGEALEARLAEILQRGEPMLDLELEVDTPGRPGHTSHYLASFAPVAATDGERLGLAGVVVDVSRLKQAELQAQAAVRARDDILAVVSHDLRSPLGALQLGAETLGRYFAEGRDETQVQRILEMMRRTSTRMSTMIRDLLDVASLQSGRLSMAFAPTEVAGLLEEAFALHQPLALEKGLKLQLRDCTGPARVLGDAGRLQQVFGNLLGNAIKFCPPGSEVRLDVGCDGPQLHFAVADSGPGIAAEHQARIFEPYWSGQQHTAQGTGLGLFISKGIIEAHGGRLWVESTPGAGATFHFTLPRAQDDAAPPAAD